MTRQGFSHQVTRVRFLGSKKKSAQISQPLSRPPQRTRFPLRPAQAVRPDVTEAGSKREAIFTLVKRGRFFFFFFF